jgi:RHS repeat-associated protein
VNVPDENPSGLGAFEFPFRFPGQYVDNETNLNYNYFRDYNPSLGRYGESDPIRLKGGLNTYAYVNGNPVGTTDSLGLAPPRPGSYYNPLPIPGQGPPSMSQRQGGFYNGMNEFTNLPTNAPGPGDMPGINVPWSLPPGIPNNEPMCGWDCPKSPIACSPGDPSSLTPDIPAFFAPEPGCVWVCRQGPFIGPPR